MWRKLQIVTDYLDIVEKLRPLAEENRHKANSKHRNGNYRTKKGLLGERFKIDIQRVDTFNDASGLKALDFSKSFGQGYDAALESLQ